MSSSDVGEPPAGRGGGEPREIAARIALEAAGVGMFEWNLATGVITWDARTLEIFGDDQTSFGGSIEEFWSRVHPDDAAELGTRMERAIDTHGEFQAEYRVQLPGGGERWVAARGRAVARVGAEAETVFIGVVTDVTDLRAADAKVARLLETMPTAFYSADADWRFTYLNERACQLLLARREDLVGRVVWDMFPRALGTDFEESYRRAVEERIPVSFDAYYPPPLDAWFEVHAWPMGDELGVYFMDVTERHRAQEAADRAAVAANVVVDIAAALSEQDDAEVPRRLARALVPAVGDWAMAAVLDPTAPDSAVPGTVALAYAGGHHADPAQLDLVQRFVDGYRRGSVQESPFLSTAVREGRVLSIDVRGAGSTRGPTGTPDAEAALRELAPQGVLLVPLLAGHRPVAAVALFFDGPVPPGVIEVAEEVLDRSRVPVENAYLSRRQRRVVEVLQRSMLAPPPPLEGAEVAVRYLPASDAARVGGDWYDAFLLRDGAAMLVIGDVVGHDIEAAATMGQVRSLLRGIAAATGLTPAGLLASVDQTLETLGTGVLATVACVRLEPTDADGASRLTWSSAGHPAPIMLGSDGRAALLAGTNDLLLGVEPGRRRRETSSRLDPGSTLILYTDGLVERRDRSIRLGLGELLRTVEEVGDAPLDALCDALVEHMVDPGSLNDDVAIIALRLEAQADAGDAATGDVTARGATGRRQPPTATP